MNQPGITKIFTLLLDKSLLKSTLDRTDRRKLYLTISKKALALCNETLQSLLPDISLVFSEWDDRSLKQFHQQLEKLMLWLDKHRHDNSSESE